VRIKCSGNIRQTSEETSDDRVWFIEAKIKKKSVGMHNDWNGDRPMWTVF
jgi:hypothetical protein